MKKARKWKKEFSRIFAVVLAAVMLFTMPGTASVAVAETAGTDDTSETSTEQTADEVAEEPESETGVVRESDVDDSNPDEPETEDEQEGTETEESSIRVIEKLIAALPGQVTEDNAEKVRTQLDEILAHYRKLTEEEQEQVDISRCLVLQTELDAANAPASIEEPSENAVAMVEKEGEEPEYVTSLTDAFTLVKTGGTIMLLTDVELLEKISINNEYNGNIILNLNGHTIDSRVSRPINVAALNANLTICGSGNIQTSKGSAVCLSDAALTLEGGSFSSGEDGSNGCGIDVEGGTLNVTSDSVTIDRLYVGSGTVSLTTGTYTGSPAIETSSSDMLSGLLDSGCAYYKDNQPLVLAELTGTTMDGSITVGVCKHPDVLKDNGDGTHGGDCPYCGAEFEKEPHTDADSDGKCDGCKEQLRVKVDIDDTATYYGTFENAWTAAWDKNATVTLLDNVTVSSDLSINGGNITFNGGDYTLAFAENADNAFQANSGTLTIAGGKVYAPAGLRLGGNIHLHGGTFESGGNIIIASSETLLEMLSSNGTYRTFYKDDQPVRLTNINVLSAGTYTVKECNHDAGGVKQYQHNDGEQTHTLSCLACGYTDAAETCTYQFADNIGTCSLCGSKIEVTVTDTENLVYDNTEKTLGVTVMLDGNALTAENNYSVTYTDNVNAGVNTASVIVSGTNWSYTKNFTINKANVTADDLNYTPPADLVYTGASRTAVITAKDNCLPGIGGITVQYKKDNEDNFIEKAVEPGTYHVYAVISKENNYNDAKIEIGSFTVDHMVPPTVLYNGSSTQKDYYNGDVAVSGNPADSHTYMVSDAINGNYDPAFTLSASGGGYGKHGDKDTVLQG